MERRLTQSVIPFANVAYPRGYTRGSPKRNFAHDVRSVTAFHYFVFSASFAAKKYTAAETAAIQRDEGALVAKEIFGGCRISLTAEPSRRTPRAESIRGRVSASSFGYARFGRFVRRSGECVIPLPLVASLPPFILRLTQPRSSGTKGLWLRKRFFLYQQRRPRQAPSRGRFRLRRFGMHASGVLVRRSGECVILFAALKPTGLHPWLA